MELKSIRVENLFAVSVAVILVLVLMTKPIVGIADNGDFARIMGTVGLEYMTQNQDDRYFGFVNRHYRIADTAIPGGYFSTQVIVAGIAVLLNKLLYDGHIFDIRFLSFIYSAIFVISMYLAIKYNAAGRRICAWILGLMLILIFCDIGYISYFNTLYGEAVSFCFLILMAALAGCLLKAGKLSMLHLILFFMAAIVLVGAKQQNSPLGILMALFSLRLWQLKEERTWKKTVTVLTALVVAVSLFGFLVVPHEIKRCNKYQTVFYGVLKDSPTPEKDLEELGIDPRFAVLAGTDYFMEKHPINIRAPELQESLYNKISHLKVILFYLKHPLRYMEKLQKTAECAFILRHGYGNYEKADGITRGDTADIPAMWSNLKKVLFPKELTFIGLYFLAWFAVLMAKHIRSQSAMAKAYVEFFMLIGAFGLVQFFIPVIGDGEADLGRHLFLFNVCFDMMFTAGVSWLANAAVQLGQEVKKLCSGITEAVK